jgi:PAS domain S-box-containing protein
MSVPQAPSFGTAFHDSAIPQWVFERSTLAFLLVNDAALRRYGHTREEFLAATILDITAPGDADTVRRWAVETDYRVGSVDSQVWEHVTRPGERLWVESALLDIVVADRPARLMQVFEVTARVRLEAERAERTRRIEEGERLRSQFFTVLGHELRQPLNAIRAATDVVTLRAQSPQLERPVAVLNRQVMHLARLIDDLTDISRISRGNLSVRMRTCDARQAVHAAIETTRPAMLHRRQALTVDLPDAPVVLTADPDRLQQVVTNLLSNASRYTPEGGAVRVRLEFSADELVLSVADSGRGIAPDLLPRVFDLFVRGDAGDPSGLGVGLALVRGLVELHGGRVEARSAGPGRGAEFVVCLPSRKDAS